MILPPLVRRGEEGKETVGAERRFVRRQGKPGGKDVAKGGKVRKSRGGWFRKEQSHLAEGGRREAGAFRMKRANMLLFKLKGGGRELFVEEPEERRGGEGSERGPKREITTTRPSGAERGKCSLGGSIPRKKKEATFLENGLLSLP